MPGALALPGVSGAPCPAFDGRSLGGDNANKLRGETGAGARSLIAQWPRRHVIVALTFVGSIVAYTDRVNISVAAVAMQQQLGWSQTEKGLVLSSFYIGYLLFMFPAGLLADRFGGKRVLLYAVLAWSVLTLLTPPAAALSLGVLVSARILMGLGESGMYPAAYELFGRWIPLTERSRAVARLTSGIPIGTLIGLMGGGWLVQRYGWPTAFYLFGALGFLWVFIWVRQVVNNPATDPRVRAEERALLPSARAASTHLNPGLLRRLVMRSPVAAIITGHVSVNWNLYVLSSWLPSYFHEAHKLSIAHAGLFSAAPWLSMFIAANVSGSFADRIIRRGVSVTTTRKLMQCIALLGSAALLLALREAHTPTSALVLLCGATAALSCGWSGQQPAYLDVAPQHSAVLLGVGNAIATVPGIVGVALTGWLVDVTGTYSAAFVLTAIVSVCGALVFALYFDAHPLDG